MTMRKNKPMDTESKQRSLAEEFDIMHDEAEIAQLNSLFQHQKEADRITEEMNNKR